MLTQHREELGPRLGLAVLAQLVQRLRRALEQQRPVVPLRRERGEPAGCQRQGGFVLAGDQHLERCRAHQVRRVIPCHGDRLGRAVDVAVDLEAAVPQPGIARLGVLLAPAAPRVEVGGLTEVVAADRREQVAHLVLGLLGLGVALGQHTEGPHVLRLRELDASLVTHVERRALEPRLVRVLLGVVVARRVLCSGRHCKQQHQQRKQHVTHGDSPTDGAS